jgi:hypothetical protein
MKGELYGAFVAVVASVLTGCSKPSTQAPAPVTTCTKAEQQCVYAEGKLGLCTPSSLECDGGLPCIVCMSLH